VLLSNIIVAANELILQACVNAKNDNRQAQQGLMKGCMSHGVDMINIEVSMNSALQGTTGINANLERRWKRPELSEHNYITEAMQ
jgi:hypothetical protein